MDTASVFWGLMVLAGVYFTVKIIVDFAFFRDEIRAAMDRDPAAGHALMVTFFYPGFKAIKYYRVGHALRHLRVPLIPMVLCYWARWLTGIEIHPGAEIGPGLFIDHGMGVVIGETTVLGRNVTLFQQVTLGGTGKQHHKRHPTVEDDVVIGAGAKVLGNILIGEGAFIGANAVVVRDVPANSTVVGVPGRITRREGRRIPGINLDHTRLPDPISKSLEKLQHEIDRIEHEIQDHHKGGKPE